MSQPHRARVLVVGDPYMPASSYAEALAGLGDAVTVTALQIDESLAPPPRTASATRLREYAGDPDDVARAAAGHDVLILHGAPVTAEVLDAGPLRLVCCARGGPVNVDVAAATERGIPVANAPGRNAEAVAELTLAFALLLIRRVPRASRHLYDGGALAQSTFEGREFLGREAPGTTMGLIGLGHVGREVAARAGTFGFTVIACDPVPPRVVPPGVAMVPLDVLLAESDLVSLHARATPENRHLLGAKQFARMRAGTCVINTARETLVDEAELRDALLRGHLGGAALDVVERPPAGQRHPLLDLPNVIITPHIGGATQETLRRGARQAVAAVAEWIAGRPPASVMNPEVLSGSGAGTTA